MLDQVTGMTVNIKNVIDHLFLFTVLHIIYDYMY
jgi:hypothetical protein